MVVVLSYIKNESLSLFTVGETSKELDLCGLGSDIDNTWQHPVTQYNTKIKRTHTSKKTDAKTRASKTHEKHKAKETYNWAPISTIPGNILSQRTTKKQK